MYIIDLLDTYLTHNSTQQKNEQTKTMTIMITHVHTVVLTLILCAQ